MNDDLPPDLPRLRVLETWLVLSLARVQQRIADVERREAERRLGERRRPPRPDWIIDMGMGAGRAPVSVHAGDCHMAGKRLREISREEAVRAIAGGVAPCTHCRPDSRLGILD